MHLTEVRVHLVAIMAVRGMHVRRRGLMRVAGIVLKFTPGKVGHASREIAKGPREKELFSSCRRLKIFVIA